MRGRSVPCKIIAKDTWAFRGLLCMLIWAPLPVASVRPWALGILLAWELVLLVACAWTWRGQLEAVLTRLDTFRAPLLILGTFVLWTWLQVLPLPPALVQLLSPEAYRVWQAAGQLVPGSVMTLSLDPAQSRLFASCSFVYLAAFALTVLLVRDSVRVERLAQTLVLSGVLQSMIGIVLFSFGAKYQFLFSSLSHERVLGTYVNPNHMAGYLEMCLGVGIGLMLGRLGQGDSRRRTWKQRAVAMLTFLLSNKMRLRLMLVIMVIALVLTRSRMGNTAFFGAMAIVGTLAIILGKRNASAATLWLIGSLIVVDVLVVGTWIGLEKVVSRVEQTTLGMEKNTMHNGGQEESVEQRSLPAIYGLKLIQDFPITGTGGGSFYTAFSRYRAPEIQGFFDHTHNDYVEIACDTGVVGLAALLALAGITTLKSLRVLGQRRDSLVRGMAFGCLMAFVALAIHSTVDFNLQIPANALTMTVILALAWTSAGLRSERNAPNATSRT